MPSLAMAAILRLGAGFVTLATAHWFGVGRGAPGLPFPCSPAARSQPQPQRAGASHM
jgi:hypothetical protein